MTPELKKKYAEFKDKIFGLSGDWATRYVSYQATDKMFVAKYEPEYPMPSDKDKIIVVTVSGRGDKDVAAIARYRGEDIYE